MLLPSARELTTDELELVEFARVTIDANTDAGPGEDGVHTMGAGFALPTAACSPASTCITSPVGRALSS